MKKVTIFLLLIIVLTACSQGNNSKVSGEISSATPLLPSDTPAPTFTFTSEPTETPIPTPTPTPIVYNQDYLDQFVVLHTITDINTRLIRGFDWSQDSSRIAFGGETGIIYVYNLEMSTIEEEIEYERRATVYQLAFHPDGILLAAGNTFGHVHIYNVETGTLEYSLETGINTYVNHIEFIDGGNYVLIVLDTTKYYKTAELLLWDYKTGEVVYRWENPHEGYPYSVPGIMFWSDEDDQLIVMWVNYILAYEYGDKTISDDYSLCAIDIRTGESIELRNFQFSTAQYNILLTPEKSILLIDHKTDGTSVVMDGVTGDVVQVLETGGFSTVPAGQSRASLSIDGRVLRVTTNRGTSHLDAVTTYWDTDTWLQVDPYPDLTFGGWATRWSPDLSMYFQWEKVDGVEKITIWGLP